LRASPCVEARTPQRLAKRIRGREAGGTGEPDARRKIDALRAQAPHPGDDRRGFEAELRDDDDAQPDLGGGFDLRGQKALELQVGDTRMAVRVARDADLHDAAPCDQTGVDCFQRTPEWPGRFRAVACDHQQLAHAGLAGQPVKQ